VGLTVVEHTLGMCEALGPILSANPPPQKNKASSSALDLTLAQLLVILFFQFFSISCITSISLSLSLSLFLSLRCKYAQFFDPTSHSTLCFLPSLYREILELALRAPSLPHLPCTDQSSLACIRGNMPLAKSPVYLYTLLHYCIC
jgi:hypothetical protein